jgi:uncharacterized protein (TIGR04222 family)
LVQTWIRETLMIGNLNPFNLSGPEFLLVYAICLGLVSAATIIWRVIQRVAPAESDVSRGKPLDIWELAYLRGRDLAVADTAVVDLSTAKLIEADKQRTRLIATTLKPNKQLSPVPFAIYRAAQSSGGVSTAKLHREIAFECERIRDHLMNRGLIKAWGDRFWETWPGYLGFGMLMAFGLSRLALGIYRDRPVGYLILLLLLTALVGFALTYTRRITSNGRKALRDSIAEMERYQAKKPRSTAIQPVGVPGHEQIPALATWTFAVMGLATAQSMLDPNITELIRKRGAVDAGSASGCSATGCGGDGGGGGGCGGGGCGGCGS